jgi:hypothetical protein
MEKMYYARATFLDKGERSETKGREFNRYVNVEAKNKSMATAKAMEKLFSQGWCLGNYLEVVDINVQEVKG